MSASRLYQSGDIVDPDTAQQYYVGKEIQMYDPYVNAFESHTTNKDTYVQHELPRRLPAPEVAPRTPVPFDASTTYAKDFPVHAIQPPEKLERTNTELTNVPFEGKSTYLEEYRQHALPPRPQPATVAPRTPTKFEGSSTYHEAFPVHAVEPRKPQQTSQYVPQNIPLDASTSYGDSFQTYEIQPRAAPPPPPPKESVPFEGTTTSRECFKAYEIEPRQPVTRSEYVPSDTKFEGVSEARESFKPHAIQPRECRLPCQSMRPSLPFDGTTTNQETFRGWKLPERRPPLGVQAVGGRMVTLIPNEAQPPVVGKQVFTTVNDDQTEMCILIFQGSHQAAPQNKLLGQFDLVGIPPAPIGYAKIEVTFKVDKNNVLSASAVDLSDPTRQNQWLSQGNMLVRTHSNDVQVVFESAATAIEAQ